MRRWLAVGVLVLAGCSDIGGVEEPSMEGADVDPAEVADGLGCVGLEEQDKSKQPGTRELFGCDLGGEPMLLFTFNSTEARNTWLHTADALGYVVVEQGPTWVLIEDESP